MIRLLACVPIALVALVGCAASDPSPTFRVEAGQYARAFEASREVVRSNRFELDRVDARAGVITTTPKTTSGLATPWDAEQTTLEQELDDLANQQNRRIRVTFTATSQGNGPTAASTDSSGMFAGELEGRVEVVIERTYVRGYRPSTRSILHSGYSVDPASGQPTQYEVPIARDSRLAARIAKAIRDRLGEAAQ